MRRKWKLILSGANYATYNMEFDEKRFRNASNDIPSLRLFSWKKPSITIGYLQKKGLENLYKLACQHDVPVVRRPTGGRAVYHDREITYSIVLPPDDELFKMGNLEIYAEIASVFKKALVSLGIPAVINQKGNLMGSSSRILCFGSVSQSEIEVEGRKILGSAQRKADFGFIQQGSLLLRGTQSILEELEGYEKQPFTGIYEWIEETEGIKDKIIKVIINSFKEALYIEWEK
ncbi:MAG: hypothetical protein JXA60_01210 [Candidatus Coatesbacteria bacterium]|nr:hypothetical protein [Candidatus Coatesbacteria bacterium]